MTYLKSTIASLIALTLVPAAVLAQLQPGSQPYLQLDSSYDQQLQYQASADKIITPAKVMRWIMGLRGDPVPAPSSTEFQPIVNVQDARVRVVAAIAYKF